MTRSKADFYLQDNLVTGFTAFDWTGGPSARPADAGALNTKAADAS